MFVKRFFATHNNESILTVRTITSDTSALTIIRDTPLSGNSTVHEIDVTGSIGLKADKLYTHSKTERDIL